MMRILFIPILAAGTLCGAQQEPVSFEKNVQPLLSRTCTGCHNEKLISGGLNIAPFLAPSSLTSKREGWERILAKLRTGEMPPKGIPRPAAADLASLMNYVQGEFDRVDRGTAPDPGRVIAHRLNRTEYANSVRDLLGVTFRVQNEFPADDSGYGFDNIGDVLTVSPTLMQKYLSVGEKIAARAVGADPLPKPGFVSRRNLVRRLEPGHIQLTDVVQYDADYVVRVNMIGHRGPQDKPVTLVISVDGKPVKTASVPVQISAVNQQAGETQRVSQEARVFIPDGEHVFSAEFVNDDDLSRIPLAGRLSTKQNIYPDIIEIAGPFPPSQAHPRQKQALLCDPASGAACVNRILSTLARRAYRRPVSRDEVDVLLRVFNKAHSGGCSAAQSLQFAITAILVSPQFLFRIEGNSGPGTIAPLTDIELASRLSFFLWSSIPDEDLLRLAEANRLHLPTVLDSEVKRMLADPKSSAFAGNFSGQWLETRSLDAVKPDFKKFPEWTPELREAMGTETRLFFEAVMRENRPISDFIDGKYSFLNDLLAKHYGIADVTGPEFRRVELTTDQRSGVFTQGSVLTVSSYPTRTSVVLRGKFLLENLLNAPPPAPPADVPALNESAVGVAQTLRKQMEQHRSDPTCASCHSRMDPLGFGLENYDAIGRWRTQDGKFPVDASGTFPNGKEFSSPASMKTLLLDNMPEFTRCIAEKMLTYSLGRGLESSDRRAVRELVSETTEHGYKLQSLILAIVHSPPFLERRGERIQTTSNTKGVIGE